MNPDPSKPGNQAPLTPEPLFRTIVADDWRRSRIRSKTEVNVVWERIQLELRKHRKK